MCADWRSRRPARASPRSWGYRRSTRLSGYTGSCSTTDVRHRQALIPAPQKARAAVTWLPAVLRDPVLDVLIAGNRLAQEAVGQELLTRVDVRIIRYRRSVQLTSRHLALRCP
jgi:hypothetical protein